MNSMSPPGLAAMKVSGGLGGKGTGEGRGGGSSSKPRRRSPFGKRSPSGRGKGSSHHVADTSGSGAAVSGVAGELAGWRFFFQRGRKL